MSDPNNNPQDLNTQIKELQVALKELEKSQSRGTEILKWGMGMFITFTLALTGYNWWTAKTNYDKDREYLKQQTELFKERLALDQRELHDSNEKRLAHLASQMESNLTASYKQHNEEFKSTLLTQATNSFAALTNAMIALTNGVVALERHFNERISNNLEHVITLVKDLHETNVNLIDDIRKEMVKAMGRSEGLGFYVQGNQMYYESKGRSIEAVSGKFLGVIQFVTAAHRFLDVNDIQNVNRCLDKINEGLRFTFSSAPPTYFTTLKHFGVIRETRQLIADIEALPNKAEYERALISMNINVTRIEQREKNEEKDIKLRRRWFLF